eukprot:CAMPEP_0115016726 /NCGR_PEP_ID=MMETSP0216-20121206/27641_1 /TAXON_ID=223996 /ORGANISM="Protocruzia adherens, Strain Boccale" /LENGTH=461 /DNA_ID=CAMNT_0002387303 /DNA_START=42 /DNA_END=1424 /DNA_ORIENTATION=+
MATIGNASKASETDSITQEQQLELLLKLPDFQRRVTIVQRQFEEMHVDASKSYSQKDLLSYLDRRCESRHFERRVAQQIFDQLNLGPGKMVKCQDFTHMYLLAEYILRENVRDETITLNEAQKASNNTRKKLLEAQKKDKLNAYGISEGSILIVEVFEARDLASAEDMRMLNPYMRLQCERAQEETQVVPGGAQLLWDDSFKFDIERGDSDLSVVVMSKSKKVDEDIFLGRVSIPLSTLRDQELHEGWFNLQSDTPGELWSGAVRLNLQWIHNQVTYLESAYKKWEEEIQEHDQMKGVYEFNLKQIREPFQGLNYDDNLIDSAAMATLENRFSDTFQKIHKKFSSQKAISAGTCLKMTYFFLIITTLNLMCRPDFYNLVVGLACWTELKDFLPDNLSRSRAIGFLVLLAFFADAFWLWTAYSLKAGTSAAHLEGAVEFKFFIMLTTLVSLVFKIPYGLYLW